MGGVCSCRVGRNSQVNAGSILDRVISQASNEDQCLLYRLANYKKGGELIEAYNQGGQPEVEKLIREQFGILMYMDGKGQTINRAEYLRWKFRDLEQVVLPIEASLSRFDPLAQWNDHQACWQMQYRGSLGETLLHVLIICDTRMHTRIARILLKCFPRLAIDVVEGEEYLGASALHLAIAYANNELVQDLVEAGAIISQRAIGSFFLPRDQQRMNPARNTDYEGLAYLGEYPLAWAACCANESVYNLLLDSGADPDEQDTFGNMILHMVVVCDKLDMFGYALRHPKLPARNGIVNAAGLTPLTLACQLGRAEVFREMLELSAREFWRYSNITCSAYPLNALDTLLPDGRTNWNSALFIILNGTKEEHLDMLDGGIIQRLLEEKWKTFARLQFLKRLIILVFHLASLSLAMYFRPADMEAVLLQWPEEITDVVRTAAECITVLGVLNYILVQLGCEMINVGPLSFLKQLSHEPAKLIFVISNLLILACIPCRIAGDRHAEDAILMFAVPGSWFLLMFFAGAIRLTGPFVTMVYSMITGDMLTFGIIYTVMLFGFSQSFYFLYKGFPGVKSSLYHSYPSTWMALFQITLGDYNYADLSNTTYPNLSKTVFAIFMVLVPILLLNMLIAMMGNTYAHVIEQSEKEFVKQWAKIVVSLERAVSQKDAHNYLQEYSIKLGPGDDPNNPASEQRGVLVIKSKSKTRAKQRKGAVSNWKRVGKVTIHELRKRGMTGEELRRIMWGRASFSTPVRVSSPNAGQPQVSAVTAGFGDALTAALDVMAFAHDFDLSTATEGIPTNIDAKQIKTAQSKAALNDQQTKSTQNNPEAVVNAQSHNQPIKEETKLPGLTDLIDKSIDPVKDVEAMNLKNTNQTKALEETVEDPFLELAIASETTTDYKTLLQIARSALATSEASMKTTIDPQILAHFAMVAPPTIEKSSIVKKQYFMESSDNDLGGDNLLGTEARLRRIKSANNRFIATKRSRRDDDGDSSSSTTSVEQSLRYRPLLNDPEQTPMNRIETEGRKTTVETIKPEVKQNGIPTKPVSPKEIEEPARRRESIERNKAASPPTSSSDPLEPWSTRGITDMNTILAWRENAPDSP
ncbi:PREDICTED: transient receptor potential cation channel subfamily V member 4 [Trachymyrmex septentrionalis]|uniref:transient receptor potential cation channel subfamily V member 4 n=1 Tax=Trachymyrmex septentrionalis TaxID=34720 RepID=UPI00084F7EA2|nr:PREDICTED: transient receptor potential cation channel subfamily V member 4 [Trachymyrmex septentrionalis]